MSWAPRSPTGRPAGYPEPVFYKKSVEERIADRMAERRPLEEGRTFEHGPAKFVFVSLIAIVVVMHVVGVAIVMAVDL